MSSSTWTWRVGRGKTGLDHSSLIVITSSCVPEKEAAPSGLQVNDTPASNNMEGVETGESTTEGEGGEKVAAEASEGAIKKKGPSNMVSGWGKNAKVRSLRHTSPA